MLGEKPEEKSELKQQLMLMPNLVEDILQELKLQLDRKQQLRLVAALVGMVWKEVLE